MSTLDALEELAQVTAPTAEQLDDRLPIFQDLLSRYTANLEGDRKQELAKWAGHLAASLVPKEIEAALRSTESNASTVPLMSERDLEGLAELRDLDLATLPQDSEFWGLAYEFGFDFRRLVARRSRKGIVLKALVTATVDAFEVLVSQILTAFVADHPDAVGQQEKEFSLSELREIGSLEEAFRVSVERRVDSLMREGFAEWDRFFAKNLKLVFRDISIDFDSIVELFQRRNALVHAQGRVTPQYKRVVGEASPPVGTELPVDAEYLAAAIDQVRCFGVLLVVTAWLRCDSDPSSGAFTELERVNYSQMEAGRWNVVKRISEIGYTLPNVPARSRLVFQFNRWLALKRLGDDFATEVQGFDDSALTRDFRCVKLALLNETEKAISLARTALAHDELSTRDLREWPVFAELREVQAFRDLAFVQAETSSTTEVDRPAPKRRRATAPRASLPN